MESRGRMLGCVLAGLALAGLQGCNGDSATTTGDTAQLSADRGISEGRGQPNVRPSFLQGEISHTHYDGVSNDLLTAGLGASGLKSATPPSFADPANPTADELRTLAIYNNYRALIDTSDGGGYGVFFGPNLDVDGNDTGTEGLIPGDEYIAYMASGAGSRVVGLVQVPESFNPRTACMVTAPSSGSRGIYGAIGTAGEWGLKHGCAVVYTDKGTGTGAHNLETNTVELIDGTLADADAAGIDAHFRVGIPDTAREAFNTATPNRFAFKHAHSQQNPEKDWGTNVLQSIEFGFYVLNEQFGKEDGKGNRRLTVTPRNTLVIASSVSNGGGASVRAAEQDTDGLIDAVVVSEPNVNPQVNGSFAIKQGDQDPISHHSRSLLDYTTAITVYQGCANAAPENSAAPLNLAVGMADDICSALAAKGLVTGSTTAERATDAQRILNEEYDIQPEQNLAQPIQFAIDVPQAIAVTYANAYGRFSVLRNLCGFSFGATADGAPTALAQTSEAALFATSNGIPPTGGVNVIYNDAVGGPTEIGQAVSSSSGLADYALDGMLCLQALAAGYDPATGQALDGVKGLESLLIQLGIEQIRATGDLHGKPAIIVTGRSDAILPINHTSRPYFGLNRRVEGSASGLHYYEVLNATHLDVLAGLAGFDALFIPLHHYYTQGLDLMYRHLREGTPLPPSQVVRTTPRGEGAPDLSAANLPDINPDPDAGDRIVFEDDLVRIPE